MKKILLVGFVSFSLLGFGQKVYSKISDSRVNSERLQIAKNFIDQYVEKCKNKDYSEFKDFIISKRVEKELNSDREKSCKNVDKIKILDFNSAYLLDYAKEDDPVELFIFNIDQGKDSPLKYISTWVYHDKNVIGGIWVSKEKPIYRTKKKNSK